MPRDSITSTNNPTIKHLVRMRDNRARRRAGRMLVDGWRETRRALESGLVPVGIYMVNASSDSKEAEPISDSENWVRDRCSNDGSGAACSDKLCFVSTVVMQKIAYGQSARGVVAEFEPPSGDLSGLEVPDSALVLVLDHIEKPGNIGAAFRCADAAGVDAVIMTPTAADRFNPNAIRSSLGAVFSVASAVAEESAAREWLAQRKFCVCAARVESSEPMWNRDLTGSLAIVIGSEAHGLGTHWQSTSDSPIEAVRIPMAGQVDSLNASVSAAVLLYEAGRQRAGS